MSQNTQSATQRTPEESRATYAAYLAKKAAAAPDGGMVYISAAEAEDISRLLRRA